MLRGAVTAMLALLALWPAQQTPAAHVELLFASDYFPHQITAATGQTWYGLFFQDSVWEVAPTRIRVAPISSGCIQNGQRVTVDRAGHPLFLLRGLPQLRPGAVQTA